MKRILLAALCAGLFLAFAAGRALAQTGGPEDPAHPPRDSAAEPAILQRLAAIDPAAVPIFKSATEAIDAGDATAARDGYKRVLVLAPDFPDALRRLSYTLRQLDDGEGAVAAAGRAVEFDPVWFNQDALAMALLTRSTPADVVEALNLAKSAADKEPNEQEAQFTLAYAALRNDDPEALRQADKQLMVISPDWALTHFFHAFVLTLDEHWEAAEQEILLGKQLGLPAGLADGALDSGIAGHALFNRWLRRSGYGVVVWVVGLLALFGSGLLLSRLTLAAVDRPARPGQPQISREERTLRSIYRTVIGITAAFYYVSIPLLIVVIIALGVGMAYAMLYFGRFPIGIATGIAIGLLYTLVAVVRSLFARVDHSEPGRRLKPDEAPELWALTQSIAKRLETRPVQAIFITPGVEVAVNERGSTLSKLRGQAERALILGLGAMPGLTRGQLRSILAHEYGHFSNRDTAGGDLARRVRASTYGLAVGLARHGQAHWFNPAWLFANLFHRLILRITLGASRLQEVLADRYAVLAYGVRDFSEGLQHIVLQSLVFDAAFAQEREFAANQQRKLDNLYTLPQMPALSGATAIQKRMAEVMARPTTAYDSHPALKDRLRLVGQVGAPTLVDDDSRPAWDLLKDPAGLQNEMTDVVQGYLRR